MSYDNAQNCFLALSFIFAIDLSNDDSLYAVPSSIIIFSLSELFIIFLFVLIVTGVKSKTKRSLVNLTLKLLHYNFFNNFKRSYLLQSLWTKKYPQKRLRKCHQNEEKQCS